MAATQRKFTDAIQSIPNGQESWAPRPRQLGMQEIGRRQCKFGELRRLATVSRPDICARLAQLASRVNSLQGSDAYLAKDLIKTAKERQQAAVLLYLSGPHIGTLSLAR